MKFLAQARRVLATTLVLVATACGGGDGAAEDPIPTELADVEAAAEDGFAAALKPDRAQVFAAAQKAANGWPPTACTPPAPPRRSMPSMR